MIDHAPTYPGGKVHSTRLVGVRDFPFRAPHVDGRARHRNSIAMYGLVGARSASDRDYPRLLVRSGTYSRMALSHQNLVAARTPC